MAEHAIPAELEFSNRPIHEDKEICEYFVNSVKANFSLKILPSTIANAGSGLFAAEHIEAGQEIFRSTPAVQCPSYCQDTTVCDYCYSSADGYGMRAKTCHEKSTSNPLEHACVGCGLKNYCSLGCKHKAWTEHHQKECDIAAQINPYPTIRLVVRLLHNRELGIISDRQWKALFHLQTNTQDRMTGEGSDIALEECRLVGKVLKAQLEAKSIQDIYCMVNANSHNMYNPGAPNVSLGAALDLLASLMNHDCEPNAFVIFEGRELRLRSQRPIARGEEITITYVTPGFGVSKRRKELKNNYYFDCQCKRCQAESSEISRLFDGDPNRVKSFEDVSEGFTDMAALYAMKLSTDESIALLKSIDTIINKGLSAFPNGDWPSHLEPLPYFMSNLASLYAREGYLTEALIYQLNSLVSERQQFGLHWAWRFYGFLLTVMQIVSQSTNGFFADAGITADELMLLCAAYHEEFIFVAKETFGEDAEFTKTIVDLCKEWVGNLGGGQGIRNRFAMDFVKVQIKLFNWARADKRLAKALSKPRDFSLLKGTA